MHESILYHIWQYKSYSHGNLKTVCGKSVTVKSPGLRNNASGPDFSMGKVKLDDLEWAGPVEIHVKTSDWHAHGHQKDEAYSNVILHVVWENDMDVPPGNVPILELKGRVSSHVLHRYADLAGLSDGIPCAAYHRELDAFTVSQWLNRMLFERMEERAVLINQWLNQTKNDWDEVAYRATLRALGRKHNQQPFEELAVALPYKILQKHLPDKKAIRALLYGVANLLHRVKDNEELGSLFEFLKHRHSLKLMNTATWNYGGVRPAAFPENLVEGFVNALGEQRLMSFWLEQLEKGEPRHPISTEDAAWISEGMKQHLFINAVFPVVFAHYNKVGRAGDCERIAETFAKLPPEKNSIVKKWKSLPLESITARETQALIQLYNKHCVAKRCLSCGIGNSILSHASN